MKLIDVLLIVFALWGMYEQGKIVGVGMAMEITAAEYEGR